MCEHSRPFAWPLTCCLYLSAEHGRVQVCRGGFRLSPSDPWRLPHARRARQTTVEHTKNQLYAPCVTLRNIRFSPYSPARPHHVPTRPTPRSRAPDPTFPRARSHIPAHPIPRSRAPLRILLRMEHVAADGFRDLIRCYARHPVLRARGIDTFCRQGWFPIASRAR